MNIHQLQCRNLRSVEIKSDHPAWGNSDGFIGLVYRSFFLSRVICLSIGSAISRQRKGFDDAYEKTKVTCHENIPMSFYKPWSKILHKAAKGWRRSKMKAKWRIVTFLLSHCTVCPFPLFPPLFSQLLHQLLTWLKKMKKSLKFCWFWLKTSG